MSDDRKVAIDELDFTSLRNIKCDHLFNGLSVWLADLYDPYSRKDVPYNIATEADIELGLELFGELGYAPKMTDLVDLIKGSDNVDTTFKRMWLLLAGNTVTAPTTSNKVSPRWYVVLQDIDDVKNLNWSKFIAHELHKALLTGKPTKGCLLFYNAIDATFICFIFHHFFNFFRIYLLLFLLYVHVIDLSGLSIVLPARTFPINLKPEFGMIFCLFGGVEGLYKFMRVHASPSCSQQVNLTNLPQIVGRFTYALVGIVGDLVQSFTSLDDEGYSDVSHQLDTGLNVISSAARTTTRTTQLLLSRKTETTGKKIVDDSDTDDVYQGANDVDSDDDSGDDFMDYRFARLGSKDHFVG
ncbi:hypothetical protein D1007_35003 [Hordeum vulgare]|nr:hypothetical protein D1007_35003 [Hordeum vulgare]